MTFPTNPSIGQSYVSQSGILYTWTAPGMWTTGGGNDSIVDASVGQIQTGQTYNVMTPAVFAQAAAYGFQFPFVTTVSQGTLGTGVIFGTQGGSGNADGVRGQVTGIGNGCGVTGAVSGGGQGAGVQGIVSGTSSGPGIIGQQEGTGPGDAIYGVVNQGSTGGHAIHGSYQGNGSSCAVMGEIVGPGPSDSHGYNNGVYGSIAASAVNCKGCGVLGEVDNGGPGSGVHGLVTNGTGYGVYGSYQGNGAGCGVWGEIAGTQPAEPHGYNNGVWGLVNSNAVNAKGCGVLGEVDNNGPGSGLHGMVTGTGGGNGVIGSSTSGFAGYFLGNVYVSGSVTSSDSSLKQNQVLVDTTQAAALSKKVVWKDYLKFKDPAYYEDLNAKRKASNRVTLSTVDTTLSPQNKAMVVGEQVGVIAQEIQALTQSLGFAQFLVGRSPSGKLTVDYNSLFGILFSGIQTRLAAIEAKLGL